MILMVFVFFGQYIVYFPQALSFREEIEQEMEKYNKRSNG